MLLAGQSPQSPSFDLPLTLERAPVGDAIRIVAIDDPETAMIALRLGLSEGENVTLISRIPGGPVVLRQGQRELALGRSLCQQIRVEVLPQQLTCTDLPKVGFPARTPISCFQ